ncbi:hypothetical protein Ddye_027026 [Dipteronia dyeriana]|uniref:DUF4371 domain-containing protein n=1 Tax=Dipteronia dyeriana TaxID=168575 RepID=A0AAD9TNY6_9ROSI|nr:hypothetical protein Ddye_027026 [Dipteronia dyeriana]
MEIILRFIDLDGFVRERFFQVVGVDDTNATTLQKTICMVLARYNLLVENLRGQGYDGASNMRVKESEIMDLIASGELETAIGVIKSATRWSSHFTSVSRFIDMFGSIYTLLEDMTDRGLNSNVRGEAKATTEQAFSAIKLIKTSIRNKMEDEFLANYLVVYMEREISDTIDLDSIIDKFDAVKTRKTKLR